MASQFVRYDKRYQYGTTLGERGNDWLRLGGRATALILQDTTEFSFKHSSSEKIGFINESTGRKMKEGRHLKHTVCGLLMHASLAITTEGLPLGLTAAKFWTRNKFKGTEALKRKVNTIRVPIEQKESMRWLDNLQRSTELAGSPERCVHIGDHERDIFELFCLAQDLSTHFLIRSCVDRLAEEGGTTISQVMAKTQVSGTHDIHFRDKRGNQQEATLSVKHATMTVCPPIGKQKKYPKQKLGIIFAEEKTHPKGVPLSSGSWSLEPHVPAAFAPQANRSEGRFDRIGCTNMQPVLCRIVVERQQRLPILHQTRHGCWVLGVEAFHGAIKRLVGIKAYLGHPYLV